MTPHSRVAQVHEALVREGIALRAVRELESGAVELVFQPGISAADVARANQIAASWSPTSVVSASSAPVASPKGGMVAGEVRPTPP